MLYRASCPEGVLGRLRNVNFTIINGWCYTHIFPNSPCNLARLQPFAWCSVIVKQSLRWPKWRSAAMATSPAKPKTACAEPQDSSMHASTPGGKRRRSEALIESDIKSRRSSRPRSACATGPADSGDQRCADLPHEPHGDIRAKVWPSRRVHDGSVHRQSCG